MIPKKILSLFDFIDYLDVNKKEYIENYIPICTNLEALITYRDKLQPNANYIDRQKYDIVQNEISEKFSLILLKIFTPVTEKLRELNIWSGDQTYSSIWNRNISSISEFKTHFTSEDISQVIEYRNKYLNFRKETNSNFLCLEMVFCELDELLKVLFEFFKDTPENEFESFEAKTIEVDSVADALKSFVTNIGRNVKFTISTNSIYKNTQQKLIQENIPTIISETVTGDKLSLGDVKNLSGQIATGKDISISNSLYGDQHVAEQKEELPIIKQQEPEVKTEVVNNPTVFISYSWDNEEHKTWILGLANILTENGVNVILDRYELGPGNNMLHFMDQAINNSDKVVMVFTPNYKLKAEKRAGGVGYEYSILNIDLYKSIASNNKYIPVLKDGTIETSIPDFIQQFIAIHMTDNYRFDEKINELLLAIYNKPQIVKPKIGKRPDFI